MYKLHRWVNFNRKDKEQQSYGIRLTNNVKLPNVYEEQDLFLQYMRVMLNINKCTV